MKHKLKILRIITSIDPKFGGPAKTIIDGSLVLYNKGINVDVLTCDKEGSNFFKSKKIKIINKGPRFGTYGFSIRLFLWLFNNRDQYDAFIIHGIWQFITLAARILLKNKYYVFIHGQLDPFFAEDFLKLIKKKIYWFLVEKKNLQHSRSILMTGLGEKETLKKTFVNTAGIKKEIIRYGIIKPKINKKKILKKFFKKFPILKNKVFYLFLGRFHEKKGCEIIIESVKKLKNNFKNIILFSGPMSGSKYEAKLINLVEKYNLRKKIIFTNALYGDLKWGAIQASKAMLLSSHGENFGVSLVESLSFGKPVLTTHKVGISNEISKFKAGLLAKDETNSFSNILKKFNNLNKNNLRKLSNNSYRCFKKNFDISLNKNSLHNLLKKNFS